MSKLREARMAADAALRERELRAEVRELKRQISKARKIADNGSEWCDRCVEIYATLAAPRKKTK